MSSIRRILSFLWIPVLLFLAMLMAANQQDVVLSLYPLPYELEWPLFALIVVLLTLGFIVGGIANWWASRQSRARSRALEKEIGRLRQEMASLRADLEARDSSTRQMLDMPYEPEALAGAGTEDKSPGLWRRVWS